MNFLGAGPGELILIAVIAMIVFGPGRLPEIMGQVGRTIRDFQRISAQLNAEFTQSIQTELAEAKATVEETKAAVAETRAALGETHAALTGALPAPQLTAAPAAASNGAATPTYAGALEPLVAAEPVPTILPPEKSNGSVHLANDPGPGRADSDLLPPY